MKGIDKLYTEKSVCANERIPRRARKSAFLGIRSFCTFPKTPGLPGIAEAESSFLPRYKS